MKINSINRRNYLKVLNMLLNDNDPENRSLGGYLFARPNKMMIHVRDLMFENYKEQLYSAIKREIKHKQQMLDDTLSAFNSRIKLRQIASEGFDIMKFGLPNGDVVAGNHSMANAMRKLYTKHSLTPAQSRIVGAMIKKMINTGSIEIDIKF